MEVRRQTIERSEERRPQRGDGRHCGRKMNAIAFGCPDSECLEPRTSARDEKNTSRLCIPNNTGIQLITFQCGIVFTLSYKAPWRRLYRDRSTLQFKLANLPSHGTSSSSCSSSTASSTSTILTRFIRRRATRLERWIGEPESESPESESESEEPVSTSQTSNELSKSSLTLANEPTKGSAVAGSWLLSTKGFEEGKGSGRTTGPASYERVSSESRESNNDASYMAACIDTPQTDARQAD